MKDKIYTITLTLVLFTICGLQGKDAAAQTEGFNVKTRVQIIADDSESLVKKLIKNTKNKRREAVPKDILCRAKCIVVLPKVKPENQLDDFRGTGLMSCLKVNTDELTPPLFYEIDKLKSFYEGEGNIIILVTDERGVKSLLANSLELTSENSEAGPLGFNNKAKTSKSYITYANPADGHLEGYDLGGSDLVYANKDTFKAYQKTMVPIDILLYDQDIPPDLRGFNSAVKELRSMCK